MTFAPAPRAGGVWQGINPRTAAVASVIWVNRLRWPRAMVFITVDGESLGGDVSREREEAWVDGNRGKEEGS